MLVFLISRFNPVDRSSDLWAFEAGFFQVSTF